MSSKGASDVSSPAPMLPSAPIGRGPARAGPLRVFVGSWLLVELDVASGERLLAGVVSGAQTNSVLVGIAGLAVVGAVDPVVERAGAVDRRGAEDAGCVAAANNREHGRGVNVEVGCRAMVLVFLVARWRARCRGIAAEGGLVAIGCGDPAAARDLTAGRALGKDPFLRRPAARLARVLDAVVIRIGVSGDRVRSR